MKLVQSSIYPCLLACINHRNDRWSVRWDVRQVGNSLFEYKEEIVSHKPSLDDVRSIIETDIDATTEQRIIEGFTYEGRKVWLTRENQQNYAALMTAASFPAKIHLGEEVATDGNDKVGSACDSVISFATKTAFSVFYKAAVSHIKKCLEEGWQRKADFDYSPYNV